MSEEGEEIEEAEEKTGVGGKEGRDADRKMDAGERLRREQKRRKIIPKQSRKMANMAQV
jgi:hypothetical protein